MYKDMPGKLISVENAKANLDTTPTFSTRAVYVGYTLFFVECNFGRNSTFHF